MLCTSSNRPLVKSINLLTLWLGMTCLLNTCGCSRPVAHGSPQTRSSPNGSEAESVATSAELEALADRLKTITEEVE